MTDIFQEVEEEVRRERYERLWKKYGNYVIGAAVLLVLGVAAYQGWRAYDLRERQQYSAQFAAAVQLQQGGKLPMAETAFQTLIKNATPGYAALARFHLAGVEEAQGKRDQAAATLRTVIAGGDPVLAPAARVHLAWLLADSAPRAQVDMVVAPLKGPANPWRFAADEVGAYLDLHNGKRAQAIATYDRLSQDMAAPEAMRRRAAALAQFLKANPANAVPKAAGTPPAAPAAQENTQK